MSENIAVTVNGSVKNATRGMTISEIIEGERPCGGHGKCGKCKVIARGELSPLSAEEKRMLTEEEIALGARLACLTRAMGNCEVITEKATARIEALEQSDISGIPLSPTFEKYGIAIDIGTTTLAAALLNPKGRLVATATALNPQARWGADVISRIEAALGGASRDLALAIKEALNCLILELTGNGGISPLEVERAVITGNTVMLSLLTEESVEPFSHAPFIAERLFGERLTAEELSLTSLLADTEVYLPSAISAFVGADTTCAILATELYRLEWGMLIDIGTNGEMALVNNGRITVCSTAAGPAFEGVGISMGMRGGSGAIDRVYIENGEIKAHVIGKSEPKGICGSGLVDLVAAMLDIGVIEEDGYLEEDEFTVLPPVSVTPRDIRMLQLAKSAICAGILTLIDSESLKTEDISRLYIAGGFGKYLGKESAARIGLLPKELAERALAVGNAALLGAVMLLLNKDYGKTEKEITGGSRVLDLSVSPTFSELYMSGMVFA
ncbi:MAG: DUF4445 domain-containing protein [Clostridia bacterium]|nr:DUF4445 domain-containing protein [Clostridia bacterium]